MTLRHRAALAALAAILVITLAWWALALWPLPDQAPPALLRARLICFGTADNGLPSGVGWMTLIGEPIMITLLLVSITGGTTIRDALRSMARHRAGRIGLRAIVTGVVLAFVAAGGRVAYALGVGSTPVARATGALDAAYPRLDRPAPALGLVDQRGATVTMATLRGRPALVTFAFAHCETVCPIVIQEVLRARGRLAPLDPAIVVVTLDPWRDRPTRLAAMAALWRLPEGSYVLGGDVTAVEAALDRWSVARARDLRTGDVTHPNLVYVIDRDGRIAYATSGDADAIEQLVRRL